MKVKSIKIGSLQTENNIFLAPMAGFTDYAFRHTALKTGYGLTFTELVSAKGLSYASEPTEALLYFGLDGEKTVAQLFGEDPYYMRKACESEELKDFKIIDINMGCPVPKVYKNGEGSALLNNLPKASLIVKECKKSGKTITVKTRTGLKKGDNVCVDFCKMLEDSGASLITLHGRAREDMFSGEIDYDGILRAKSAVKIPIIANGGIYNAEDADKVMDRTGADGVMLGRGAIYNPLICFELLKKDKSITKKEFIINHLEGLIERLGDFRAAVEFRKFVSYYFKSVINIKEEKLKLTSSVSGRESIEILNKIL